MIRHSCIVADTFVRYQPTAGREHCERSSERSGHTHEWRSDRMHKYELSRWRRRDLPNDPASWNHFSIRYHTDVGNMVGQKRHWRFDVTEIRDFGPSRGAPDRPPRTGRRHRTSPWQVSAPAPTRPSCRPRTAPGAKRVGIFLPNHVPAIPKFDGKEDGSYRVTTSFSGTV